MVTEDRLSKLYKREADMIGELKRRLEALKGIIVRVKTEGVKDGVEKLNTQFDVLVKSREAIRSECKFRMAGERSRADALATDNKITDQAIGDSISKMRETRNGNVLIEILGGNEAVEVVKKEFEKVLRPGESVKSLEQRSLIQLRDLDCVTTKEDVSEAIRRETGVSPEDVKVLTIRQAFAREQTSVVLISR